MLRRFCRSVESVFSRSCCFESYRQLVLKDTYQFRQLHLLLPTLLLPTLQVIPRRVKIVLTTSQVSLEPINLQFKREAIARVLVANHPAFTLERAQCTLHRVKVTITRRDTVAGGLKLGLQACVGLRSAQSVLSPTSSLSAMTLRCASASLRCRAS